MAEHEAPTFLAFCRCNPDSVLLASHSTLPQETLSGFVDSYLKKLIDASRVKVKDGGFQRLQWGEGCVAMHKDAEGSFLYLALLSSLAYPEAVSYKLLSDVEHLCKQTSKEHGGPLCATASENELDGVLRPRLQTLQEHYAKSSTILEPETAQLMLSLDVSSQGRSPMEVGSLEVERDKEAQSCPQKCTQSCSIL